jgi:UDP-2,4-diacetamido-2,4,6-trideoxy-beta-L-altropyranose hydrolase
LVVRADADAAAGSGHFMRGLALAQAWKALGGPAALAGSCSPALASRAAAAGVALRPASGHAPAAGGWLAVDGYGFSPEQLDAFRSLARTLVVDDYGHRPRLPADVVLNPGSEDFPYAPSDALVLAGPRWAPLRPEFAAEPPRREGKGARPRVLVCLGGSDPGNVTQAVLKALRPYDQLDVTAVIGADNPHAASLDSLARDLRRGVPDLRALMLECDAAIVAGGVTALECAAAGLPMAVLTAAENQVRQARALCDAGAAVWLGEERAPARIAEAALAALSSPGMGEAGRRLVDGRGAQRAASALAALSKPKLGEADVVFRLADPRDLWPLWRLANESSVRANSFSKEPIPAEAHARWFAAQLADPKVRFFVLEAGGAVAAQVRAVRGDNGAAEVHFAVAAAFRGKGLGTLALKLSRARAAKELGAAKLKALVIEPNEPSARAFLGAGYARAGKSRERGVDCSVFEAAC